MTAWADLGRELVSEGVLHILKGFEYLVRLWIRKARTKEQIARIPCPMVPTSKLLRSYK